MKYKKLTILFILICFLFSSCGRLRGNKETETTRSTEAETESSTEAADETTETQTDETEPDSKNTNPVILQFDEADAEECDAVMKNHGCVGGSVALIKDGAIFHYEYGKADVDNQVPVISDTKFRVASLSKLVTDIVFMALADKGITDTDENIENYLNFRVRNPNFPDKCITPKMLMCHTSSIIDSEYFLSSRQNSSSTPLSELLSYSSTYSGIAPGQRYNYSNFGVAIIGAICEKVTNRPFDEIAKEYLFGPMEIDAAYTASHLEEPELVAALYGFGGYSVATQMNAAFCSEIGQTHHLTQGNLTVSAVDYAKILTMLLNGGTYNGKKILSKQSVDEILTCHYQTSGYGVGYGVQIQENVIDGKTVYVHTGSNFGMFSTFAFIPEENTGIVILTSGADGIKNANNEIYQVCCDVIKTVL